MTNEQSKAVDVYVALGSNLEDPENNLRLAMDRLDDMSERSIETSSVWRSTPEGFSEKVPDFCNAVARIWVTMSPLELLEALQSIEQDFGRTRSSEAGYQSRSLDLDIIAFGMECIDEPGLTIPHPRAHERQFVLLPLQEICPTFQFPNRGESLQQLIDHAPVNPMRKTIRLNPSA